MKLYFDKRLKDPTYYAQQGIRNGKKTTTRNVRNFGKHSQLLKITDDPESYVRELIKKMNEEYRVGRIAFNLTADFNEKVIHTDNEASTSNWMNIGYFFLQDIMKELNLNEFFQRTAKGRLLPFDCFTVSRFLTYGRILDPRSLYATWDQPASYYEQPDFDYQHILQFMDILEKHYDDYLAWLFKNSNSIVKQDTSALYYDCTNFYFEGEPSNEDVIDEVTGEVIYGLRNYGIKKEQRPNPSVEMGLFMDSRGIPVSMCLHTGASNEQVTAAPSEHEVLKTLDGSKFIYCADAGLGSYNLRKFNSMGGKAFIVTQSIKKLSSDLKKAVFSDDDYHLLSDGSPVKISAIKDFDRYRGENLRLYNDFACKVITLDKTADFGLYEDKTLKNGSNKQVNPSGPPEQRLIITFSRKMMEYQRTVRNRQVERARKLLDLKNQEEIKKGPNDVKKFMKKITRTKSGETVVVKYVLDEAKIAEEEKYDGYHAVATNLQNPTKDILAVSHKRYQIEDSFRIMKTNYTGRPINHRLPNRIKAHFMICYTALLVYRLLEVRLEDQNTYVTSKNLITTLKSMNVTNVHNVEYMALYSGSRALDALTQLTSLGLDRLHYKPMELNGTIKKLLR